MEEDPCVCPNLEKQMPRWGEMFKGFMEGNAYKMEGVGLEKATRATRLSCWSDLCGGDRAERKKVLNFSAVLRKFVKAVKNGSALVFLMQLSHWSGRSQ